MNGGVKKRFSMMINASMFTIGRIKQPFRMSEQSISGIDSTSRESLDAMVLMISAENVVQKIGVQAVWLQAHKVP
eukprot:734801-Amphidinium_carterae.1